MRSPQYVYYLFQTNIFTRPLDQSSHSCNIWPSNKDLSFLNWTNRPEISVQWWDLYNTYTICFKLLFLLDHWTRVFIAAISEPQIRNSLFWTHSTHSTPQYYTPTVLHPNRTAPTKTAPRHVKSTILIILYFPPTAGKEVKCKSKWFFDENSLNWLFDVRIFIAFK